MITVIRRIGAWAALVERHSPLIWSLPRTYSAGQSWLGQLSAGYPVVLTFSW